MDNMTESVHDGSNCAIGSPSKYDGQICPLCQSRVRLYFLNFHEKIPMCENSWCTYPFEEPDFQPCSVYDGHMYDEEASSITSQTCSFLISVETLDGFSDAEKLSQLDNRDLSPQIKPCNLKNEEIDRENEIIMKNVEDVRKMNEELTSLNEYISEDSSDLIGCITNEKLIKKLSNLQRMSGHSLLKPEEINLLKKREVGVPALGLGELKINIDSESLVGGPSICIEYGSDSQVENSGPSADESLKGTT